MPGRVRSPRDERGAVAVEMALITPILVMLVFGIIQFGIVFAQKLALSNAAREAARAGVVAVNDSAKLTCQEIADQIENTAGTVGLQHREHYGHDPAQGRPDGGLGTFGVRRQHGGSMSNASTRPCSGATANGQLIVNASTPATLAIPFAVSTSFALDGMGAYRCEYR